MTVTFAEDGSLLLPKEVRDALGVNGKQFEVEVRNGELRLFPALQKIHPAQAVVRASAKRLIGSEEFLATRERD